MDEIRSVDTEDATEWDFPGFDEPEMEPPPVIGTDERRMHVRAYEHWVSLLNGRAYPSIVDLDPTDVSEFGPYSVLLDFSQDQQNPTVAYVGRALREEDGLTSDISTTADVPGRSILSRLTDHYLEIIANRAPVGFEAEFVSHLGQPTMYRGILMPFSSDGETIDYIYGVINWKEAADESLPDDIVAAVTTAFSGPAQPAPEPLPEMTPHDILELTDELLTPTASIFGAISFDDAEIVEDTAPGLHDCLAEAREQAHEAVQNDSRSRGALYRAIGLAYDLALLAEDSADDYAEMLEEAGLTVQERAPMTPIVKLVFGAEYDKTRLTEFAAVLCHARRLCMGKGMVEEWLRQHDGGIKAIVAAERKERRPALKVDLARSTRGALRAAPARAVIDIGPVGEEFVLLMARRENDGTISILTPLPNDAALMDRALKRLAK